MVATDSMQDAGRLGTVSFWEDLVPQFHIGETPFRGQDLEYKFSADEGERLARQIRKEGYFQAEPLILKKEFEAMADAVSRLAAAKILPVFVSVYDEFWHLLYKLRNTFTPILGDSYRLPADFWVWHIAPDAERRGWGLHRDAQLNREFDSNSVVRKDGSPRMCTVWVPFTDADTHNSCMYVLPFPHDPAYQYFITGESLARIKEGENQLFLGEARALPARAGSVVGWTPYILHWGSRSTDWARQPRISVGIYYQGKDSAHQLGTPFDDAGRRYIDLTDPDFPLGFVDRLTIIANICTVYIQSGHMKYEPSFSDVTSEFCGRWSRNT